MSIRSTLALAGALAVLACAPLAQAEPTMYTTDPDHTFATFEISHFGASIIRGRFDKVQGSVQLDRKARTGRVDLVVDVNSLSVGVPSFEKHVRGNEILDAGQHPTARFVGTQFTFDGDKVTAVAGELTLKGKTQPVTFKANQFACYDSPILKTEVCGGDFEATIDRTAFGVDYMVSMGFTKQVRIVAQIEAAKR